MRCANDGLTALLKSPRTRSEKKARPASQPDDPQADRSEQGEKLYQGTGDNAPEDKPHKESFFTGVGPWGANIFDRLGAALKKLPEIPKPLLNSWNTAEVGLDLFPTP